MNNAANTRFVFRSSRPKINDVGTVMGLCGLLFALIMGRVVSDAFFYVFAAAALAVFALSNTKYCIPMLMFLLPFSPILKSNPASFSVFTLLWFLVVLKLILKHQRIEAEVLVFVILMMVYGLMFSGFDSLTTVVTIMVGMLMLYYVRNENVDAGTTVMAFSIGMLLASMLALLKTSFPIVNDFVKESVLKHGADSAVRFSGLQGNPNYYTMDIIMALASLVVLMLNFKSKKSYTALLLLLSMFGLTSVSKSFIISWMFLAACWLFMSFRQGFRKLAKFVWIISLGVIVAYYYLHDYINAYLIRFLEDETSTMDGITTGRLALWMAYIDAVFDSVKTFLLGNGLNTMLLSVEKGAHNTYLEGWFQLGAVGTGIYLASLRSCLGKIKMRNAVWIPVAVLLLRMFAIGILTYDNLFFYLLLILLLHQTVNQNSEA